jgi:hypothetical protein
LEFKYWFSVRENWRKMLKERDLVGEEETQDKEKITSQMDVLQGEMDRLKAAAMKRGQDPRNRAAESGRDWKEGDGF